MTRHRGWRASLTALARYAPLVAVLSCEAATEPPLTGITMASAWTAPTATFDVFDTVPGVPRVRLVDASGRGVGGREVVFVLLRPPSVPLTRAVRTNASGYASFDTVWVLGARAPQQELLAVLPSGSGQPPISFAVNVAPGPPLDLTLGGSVTWNGIALGDSVQLSASLRDAYGNSSAPTGAVTYSSSNTGVATISPTGMVRSVAPGLTALVASSAGFVDTLEFGVRNGPVTITVDTVDATPATSLAVTAGRIAFLHRAGTGDFTRVDLAAEVALGSDTRGLGLGAFAYLPGSNTLWFSGDTGTAIVRLDPTSGAELQRLAAPSRWIRAAASANDEYVFGARTGNLIDQIATSTGALSSVQVAVSGISDLTLDNARGAIWAVSTGPSRLYRFQFGSLTVTANTALSSVARAVALHPLGLRFYVATDAGVQIRDPRNAAVIATFTATGGQEMAVSPNGRCVVLTRAGTDGRIVVLDAVSGAVLADIAAPDDPRRIAFDPVTGDALIAQNAGPLLRLDLP